MNGTQFWSKAKEHKGHLYAGGGSAASLLAAFWYFVSPQIDSLQKSVASLKEDNSAMHEQIRSLESEDADSANGRTAQWREINSTKEKINTALLTQARLEGMASMLRVSSTGTNYFIFPEWPTNQNIRVMESDGEAIRVWFKKGD